MRNYYFDFANACIFKSDSFLEENDSFVLLPAPMASYFSHKMKGKKEIKLPESVKNSISQMLEAQKKFDEEVSKIVDKINEKRQQIESDFNEAIQKFLEEKEEKLQKLQEIQKAKFDEIETKPIEKDVFKTEIDSLFDEIEKEQFQEYGEVVKLENLVYMGKSIECYLLYEFERNIQKPRTYYLWYSEAGLKVMREEGKRFSKMSEKRKSSFLNFEAIEKNRTEEREKAESLKVIIRQVAESSGFSFEDVQRIIKIA